MTLAELLKTRKPPFILKNLSFKMDPERGYSAERGQVETVDKHATVVFCTPSHEYHDALGNYSFAAAKRGFMIGWEVRPNNPSSDTDPKWISFDSWSLNP